MQWLLDNAALFPLLWCLYWLVLMLWINWLCNISVGIKLKLWCTCFNINVNFNRIIYYRRLLKIHNSFLIFFYGWTHLSHCNLLHESLNLFYFHNIIQISQQNWHLNWFDIENWQQLRLCCSNFPLLWNIWKHILR